MEEPERLIPLERLLQALPAGTRVAGSRNRRVTRLTLDSRQVNAGAIFVAVRGEHADGHDFAAQAAQSGAAAIVAERSCELPPNVTAIVVPDSARAASQLADAFYGAPSRALRVAGVTGTNGKTTVVQMVAAICRAANVPAGTIGTIGARFGDSEWTLANTTPPAPELHALLARMRDLGARAIAMEVSSHALALQRVADVHFVVAALTNVTRDHLDFHKTLDAYAAAKRRLFDLAPCCVLNVDDWRGARWAAELCARVPVTTYALEREADLRPSAVSVRADGSSFTLDGRRFDLRLPGRFNVANALCAIGVARALGVRDGDAAAGLASLERVAGRMEHVRGAGVDVVVDYAHTPDALETTLRSLRETAPRRLIVIFGCGGDRDRGKRAQMGAVAAACADLTIVTSDNPRTEEPRAIVDAVLAGVGTAPHEVLVDRRAAIDRAIAIAENGDVVLIAGKGHERYQIVGDRALPFDDAAIARAF